MRFIILLIFLVIIAIFTKDKQESAFLWKKIAMLIILFLAVVFLANYLI